MSPDAQPLKPCPSALYPCKHCCSDYSWPAEDLFWSEAEQAWVCLECWNDDEEAKGISLADELNRRADTAQELRALEALEAAEAMMAECRRFLPSHGTWAEDGIDRYELVQKSIRAALARPEPVGDVKAHPDSERRCASCTYWQPCPTIAEGCEPEKICGFSKNAAGGLNGQDGRAIITPPDFGCIHWKATRSRGEGGDK